MFGKRSNTAERSASPAAPAERMEPAPLRVNGAALVIGDIGAASASQPRPANVPAMPSVAKPPPVSDSRSDDYYHIKSTIFGALIDTIDLAQLAQLDPDSAREEIRDIVNEIISIKAVVMSIAEQE